MSAIQMAVLLMCNGTFNFTPTISADTMNYNLRAAAVAAGWNQMAPLNATVTINSGVYVGSSTTSGYGFDTGAGFPADTTLAVVNNGFIVGCGGDGGALISAEYTRGAPGGHAFRAQAPVTVTNNGTIAGGGGGGGGGNGGGGAGYAVGKGAGNGSNGTKTSGGAAGSLSGKGGDLGGAGSNSLGGTGGASGKAIVGNANITWAATGTRMGPIT